MPKLRLCPPDRQPPLTGGLRGTLCQPYGNEPKIKVADRSIRYPEAFVVCSPVPPRATVVTDPVVIFEVPSESSAADDFVTKNAEYQATPSVQRYVIFQQAARAAVVYSRKGDDWVFEVLLAEDAILRMPRSTSTFRFPKSTSASSSRLLQRKRPVNAETSARAAGRKGKASATAVSTPQKVVAPKPAAKVAGPKSATAASKARLIV